MGDRLIILVFLGLLALTIAGGIHQAAQKESCIERGGIYLESQCVKGEIIP